jgi:hypothetical protein
LSQFSVHRVALFSSQIYLNRLPADISYTFSTLLSNLLNENKISSLSSSINPHIQDLKKGDLSLVTMPSQSSQQYMFVIDVKRQPADAEINQSWKLPYTIDDSDLTFDGKPLNMLYEENRWKAEHVLESRVKYSSHGTEKSHVSTSQSPVSIEDRN